MKNRYILTISVFMTAICSMFNGQTLQAQGRITKEESVTTREVTRPMEPIAEVMDTGVGADRTTKIVTERTVNDRYDRPSRYDDDRYVVRRRYVRPSRQYYSGRPYRRYSSRPSRRYYDGRDRRYYDDGYYYRDRGSDVLGGAATGALIGGVAGGGRGAAIGAGVGAGLGAFGG